MTNLEFVKLMKLDSMEGLEPLEQFITKSFTISSVWSMTSKQAPPWPDILLDLRWDVIESPPLQ